MKRNLALILALATVACGSEDLSEPQDDETFAIIYGRIIDTEGLPVANANITAVAFATCASTTSIGTETSTTNANGNYRVRVENSDTNTGCVELRAIPVATNTTLIGDTLVIENVQFKEVPTDSILRNINFALRGSGGGGPGNPGS